MPENIEDPRGGRYQNYDVVLAEIKQAMIYLSRDVSDLKITQAKQLDHIIGDVEVLKAWKERTDGAIRIISRAQALLYVVFSAGFSLGVWAVLVHH